MIAHKFLGPGAVGVFSRFAWPEPGEWVDGGTVEVCRSGVHACRIEDLPYWLGAELWEVELGGRVVVSERKVVAERARLRTRIDGWPEAARELAAECARRCRERATGSDDPMLIGYAGDCDAFAERGDAALAAYIAAHAAGAEQAQERAWQAGWIARRLSLSG